MNSRSCFVTAMLVVAAAGGLVGPPALGENRGASSLMVQQAVIATGVEAREPVGEAASFPADVGKLVCYTRILGATDETEVEHTWFHGQKERSRVRLPVRDSPWRTWSTKNISPEWTRHLVGRGEGHRGPAARYAELQDRSAGRRRLTRRFSDAAAPVRGRCVPASVAARKISGRRR